MLETHPDNELLRICLTILKKLQKKGEKIRIDDILQVFGNRELPKAFEWKDTFKYYVNAKMMDLEDTE